MSPYERYGRILLALAVALLFATTFISMISGALFTTGLIVTGAIGVVGAAGMLLAKVR